MRESATTCVAGGDGCPLAGGGPSPGSHLGTSPPFPYLNVWILPNVVPPLILLTRHTLTTLALPRNPLLGYALPPLQRKKYLPFFLKPLSRVPSLLLTLLTSPFLLPLLQRPQLLLLKTFLLPIPPQSTRLYLIPLLLHLQLLLLSPIPFPQLSLPPLVSLLP